MVSATPLASVIIPAYNQGEFLLEAIDSALSQTLRAVEVVVVDDGSTDDTQQIAAGFDDRIVYVRQVNQGLAAARNTGIRTARGPLLQFLDSDDALYPDSLERACDAAVRHSDASVFTASWDEMDRAGRIVARVDAPPLPSDVFHGLFYPMLVGPPCRFLVRRSAFTQAGLFDTRLAACEDWDMWLRIAAAGLRFVAVPAARVRYRNYATSMSKDYCLMWRSGRHVLTRAARVHSNCPKCRLAVRSGVASWREWCYVSMLAPKIRERCDRGRYYAAARTSLTALARDPRLAPYLLRSALARTRRLTSECDRTEGEGTRSAGLPFAAHKAAVVAIDNGPDFVVIGAQRAGTTRLCGLLNRCPGVAIPTKEPMFFQSPEDMRTKAAWYQALFDAVPDGMLTGEGSTYYSMCGIYPGTAQRIHQFNPDVKIIYMVRHPLRRIESAWAQLLSVGAANRARGFDFTLRNTELLIDPSLYWRQISEYRRYFPDRQILIQYFDDFSANEGAVVEACCCFLGLPPAAVELAPDRFRNESIGKRQRAWIVDGVRTLPRYEVFKSLIPQRGKTFVSTHFTSPISTETTWTPDTLAWAIERLEDDNDAFLRYAGRSPNYWAFESWADNAGRGVGAR